MGQLREDRWLFWVSLAAFLVVWLIANVAYAQEQNDVLIALRVAKQYQLSPFQTRALLCVRAIEDGWEGREYGVLQPQAVGRDQLTQARWAAGTIRKRLRQPGNLAVFASRWVPIGAANDPQGLNQHWRRNFDACMEQLE